MMESTHATLERTSIDIGAVELTDRHRGLFVSVHSDEREPTIRLEACLQNVSELGE